MSDKNFNSIKNFEVPQSWIDGALNIPVTSKDKAPVIFFVKYSKFLVSAACILIVCMMSLFLLFRFNNNTKLTIDNTTQTDSITDSTSVNQNSPDDFEQGTNKNDKDNSDTNPSNGQGGQGETQTPSTDAGEDTDPTSPTDMPSEPSVKPTDPEPTDPPTAVPTDPPTEEPTVAPTDPPIDFPTDSPPPPIEPIIISTAFDRSLVASDYKVYCKVYDLAGNFIGDPDLFSSQHVAQITRITESTVYASYCPDDHNLIKKMGYYYFQFYNSDGEIVAKVNKYIVP